MIEEIINILKTRKQCVLRETYNECNRDCENCDLALPSNDILKAYDIAIDALMKQSVNLGKWRHYEGMLTCSICGSEYYADSMMEQCGDEVPHFCPNCGTDMTEEDKYDNVVKDCTTCYRARYNDHWDGYFCYSDEECMNFELWEPKK